MRSSSRTGLWAPAPRQSPPSLRSRTAWPKTGSAAPDHSRRKSAPPPQAPCHTAGKRLRRERGTAVGAEGIAPFCRRATLLAVRHRFNPPLRPAQFPLQIIDSEAFAHSRYACGSPTTGAMFRTLLLSHPPGQHPSAISGTPIRGPCLERTNKLHLGHAEISRRVRARPCRVGRQNGHLNPASLHLVEMQDLPAFAVGDGSILGASIRERQ